MLKQLILENWKSFRYAELPLDTLTVLIGTNASGKSNVVEALEFLQRTFSKQDIKPALWGDSNIPSIRGGVESASFSSETKFQLKVVVQSEEENIDYIYCIAVQTKPFVKVLEESFISQEYQLKEQKKLQEICWLKNYPSENENIRIIESWQQLEDIDEFYCHPSQTIFTDALLAEAELLIPMNDKMCKLIEYIKNIFILDTIPYKMRDFSHLSDNLESDASNIAGVLAALPDEKKAEVEATISAYVKDLPEGDIKKVWSEKVGRFGTDAMLYCQEEWKPGHITEIDARSMSDGTLRFIAILTALLTRPEGSQIVIEEVDNGLHPSRTELLVRILREIGSKRKIDILITTHNPALLDALGPEIVPFVVVAHRDFETGESTLSLLEDINNFPKLFASASLDKLTTSGAIERNLSRSE